MLQLFGKQTSCYLGIDQGVGETNLQKRSRWETVQYLKYSEVNLFPLSYCTEHPQQLERIEVYHCCSFNLASIIKVLQNLLNCETVFFQINVQYWRTVCTSMSCGIHRSRISKSISICSDMTSTIQVHRVPIKPTLPNQVYNQLSNFVSRKLFLILCLVIHQKRETHTLTHTYRSFMNVSCLFNVMANIELSGYFKLRKRETRKRGFSYF